MNQPLPKSVQAQIDNANRIVTEMNAKSDAPAEAVAESNAPTEVAAPVETSTVSTPAQETPAPVAPPVAKTEDWEHKYRVLQGMFKAEVGRQVEQAVAPLKAQNDQLRDLVSTLQKPAPAAPETRPDGYSFVKHDEEEEYGADLLDVAARKAKEQYLPLIESLQNKIAQLEGQFQQGAQRMDSVEQVSVRSARDVFFSQLDNTVPSWATTNVDPGFLSWLDSVDELTGTTRREHFNRAYGQLDVNRVAKFFDAYTGATGAPAAKPAPAASMQPTVPLDQLQAPGKARTAPPAPAKKTISRAEITAFYNRQRQGAYRGREADAARFEAEIFAAQAENRIT